MAISRTTKRRILALGLPLLLLGGFKGWMLWGPAFPAWWSKAQDAVGRSTPVPSAPPALFPWHAELLLKSELGFPRTLEAMVPAPAKGSNAALQLGGMGWWDGNHWTAKALEHGSAEGRFLRVRVGQLVVAEVDPPSPARDYNGPQLCQVDFKVRWDLPAELSGLIATERIVGLRRPEALPVDQPGALAVQQVTFEKKGLGFRLWKGDEVRAALPGRPAKGRAWWRWFL